MTKSNMSKNFYSFAPGDGTHYSVKLTKDPHGGIYCIVNNTSLWRMYVSNYEIKHLCGDDNEYTRRALHNYFKKRGLKYLDV